MGTMSVYSAEDYSLSIEDTGDGNGLLMDYNTPTPTLMNEDGVPIIMPPVKPPKPERKIDDYKAEAKSGIYEIVSKNGVVESLDVELEIFETGQGSKKSGHGKANIVVGRDLKERRFEVPVILKSDKFTFGKVRDLDTGDNFDLVSASLFAPPDKDKQWDLMDKEYVSNDYNSDTFDDGIKRMKEVFASADDDEVRAFMAGKAEDEKLKKNAKYRKIGGFAAVGMLGAFMLYLHFKTDKKDEAKEEYSAEDDYIKYKKLRGYDE